MAGSCWRTPRQREARSPRAAFPPERTTPAAATPVSKQHTCHGLVAAQIEPVRSRGHFVNPHRKEQIVHARRGEPQPVARKLDSEGAGLAARDARRQSRWHDGVLRAHSVTPCGALRLLLCLRDGAADTAATTDSVLVGVLREPAPERNTDCEEETVFREKHNTLRQLPEPKEWNGGVTSTPSSVTSTTFIVGPSARNPSASSQTA